MPGHWAPIHDAGFVSTFMPSPITASSTGAGLRNTLSGERGRSTSTPKESSPNAPEEPRPPIEPEPPGRGGSTCANEPVPTTSAINAQQKQQHALKQTDIQATMSLNWSLMSAMLGLCARISSRGGSRQKPGLPPRSSTSNKHHGNLMPSPTTESSTGGGAFGLPSGRLGRKMASVSAPASCAVAAPTPAATEPTPTAAKLPL